MPAYLPVFRIQSIMFKYGYPRYLKLKLRGIKVVLLSHLNHRLLFYYVLVVSSVTYLMLKVLISFLFDYRLSLNLLDSQVSKGPLSCLLNFIEYTGISNLLNFRVLEFS